MLKKQTLRPRIILLVIILFIALITVPRFLWFTHFNTYENIVAEKGIIDLSKHPLNNKKTFALNGEWTFYPNEFIVTKPNNNKTVEHFIQVPGNWKDQLNAAHGYGTYHLKILLPKQEEHIYGIQLKDFQTFANVYVNGQLINKENFAEGQAVQKIKKQGPMNLIFSTEAKQIDLVIQMDHFSRTGFGGFKDSIQFGLYSAIIKEASLSKTLQLIVSTIFFLHALYAIFIFMLGGRHFLKELLYFGLLLILQGFTILIDDDVLLQLPVYDEIYFRLLIILLLSAALLTLKFINILFKTRSKISKILFILFLPVSLSILLFPILHLPLVQLLLTSYGLCIGVALVMETLSSISKGHTDGIFILFYLICFLSNAIWGASIKLSFINIPYYPVDYILSIIMIALLLFKRHINVIRMNTEQKKRLEEADRRKDIFLANTSHELRNPLHGILNIGQAILEDKTNRLSTKNQDDLKLLILIGRRMAYTLNDLLDLIRLNDGRIILNREPVNLTSILSTIMEMMHFMHDTTKVRMVLNIPTDFPNVDADENRLVQIFFNLLHNACKFTKEGEILISAQHNDNFALIEVCDTGIGMNDVELERIFQRYEQADTTDIGGIGLGLNICKQFVELHGGNLDVESRLGEGSTFSFSLPLAKNNNKLNKKDVWQPDLTEQEPLLFETENLERKPCAEPFGRILIVDDNPVNLRILNSILEDEYLIEEASSGIVALERIKHDNYDLIISDVMMPKMTGYELSRKIRENYTISELPILLLTSYDQPANKYTGFLSGANDYLTKPADAIELKARTKALITLKRSIKEQLRLEAAWLQAQIKPHFLFNTLNSIASLAELDSERMIQLLHEFGNYLRRSFNTSNVKSLIPIEDELDLVRSYLFIEGERFGSRLSVNWELEDLTCIEVPPLSIQTLIENAVHHGILKKQTGGTITIAVENHHAHNKVSISDDGIGIAAEHLIEIFDCPNRKMEGIGLVNTNRRIHQLFGTGLEVTSNLGIGTTVSFNIPHIPDES